MFCPQTTQGRKKSVPSSFLWALTSSWRLHSQIAPNPEAPPANAVALWIGFWPVNLKGRDKVSVYNRGHSGSRAQELQFANSICRKRFSSKTSSYGKKTSNFHLCSFNWSAYCKGLSGTHGKSGLPSSHLGLLWSMEKNGEINLMHTKMTMVHAACNEKERPACDVFSRGRHYFSPGENVC